MSTLYVKPVTKDEQILLLLKEVLHHNIDVCQMIMKYEKTEEQQETMDYHMYRWETIARSHFTLHDTHEGKFSYIFDREKYVLKCDHKPTFYNVTGISYQVVELLHELIKLNKIDTENSHIEDYKYWLEHDDMLYTALASKIKIIMDQQY